MNINQRLLQLRKNKKISVYRLSQLSEISENYIRKIERNECVPSVPIITRLLQGLGGITLAEFFTEEGSTVMYPTAYEKELIYAARELPIEKAEAVLQLAKMLRN